MGRSDSSDVDQLPAAGELVARKYLVERVIASGGMGVVMAARQEPLGRRVALKFLSRGGRGDSEVAARFLREAQAAARLRGEHTIQVLDVGTLDDGLPYMVMEHLDGHDLRSELESRGPLPVVDAVEYVLQACEAIAEAHSKGIVHRDIKPANLFLTQRPDGSPQLKVLDFGISKSTADGTDLRLTATTSLLGSPHYMAPEQLRSARLVDPRSDIWSLGVTLHELLADETPFSGESVTALSAAITADPPARVRERQPHVPVALEAVILRCLAKDPQDRFQSVAELALALAPFAPKHAQVTAERAKQISRNSVPELQVPLRVNLAGSHDETLAEADAPEWLRKAGALNERTDGAKACVTATRVTASEPKPWSRRLWVAAILAAGALVVTLGLALRSGETAPAPAPEPLAQQSPTAIVPHDSKGPLVASGDETHEPSLKKSSRTSRAKTIAEPVASVERAPSPAPPVQPRRGVANRAAIGPSTAPSVAAPNAPPKTTQPAAVAPPPPPTYFDDPLSDRK